MIITKSVDYLFVSYEVGVKGNVVSGPSEWWKFWEIKIGVKINIGNFNASVGVGLTGIDASFGYKNNSVDIRVWLDRIGVGTSYEKDGIILYEQYDINTIPTALAFAAVAVCILAPEAIPAIALAIAVIAMVF